MWKELIFGLVLMAASAVLNAQTFAATHFHKEDPSLPAAFIATSDRPFSSLMEEADAIMHRDMEQALRDGNPDHDFVTMMIPHHQGAIDMAKVLLIYGRDKETRNLSQGIIASQQYEIKIMQEWLKRYKSGGTFDQKGFAGIMQGAMAAMHDGMQKALRTGDPDHDFVTMMVPHHQGAIDMAKGLLIHGNDTELLVLAQQIITEQEHEIRLMHWWLGRHGAGPASGPGPQDRVYTADQISNTVSVIDPSANELLGQIRLGNVRPDVLSPLYRGELNVHGLGFSPDHRTLLVISTGSNSATFIDTSTNTVKGTVYIGRSPHEGFFTADGKEAWVVVRGENYISVLDPRTFRETGRIETTSGPGMVIFHPDGKYAYVCNSFNPVFEVVDVARRQVIKKIGVASPFSPYLVMTPDLKEIWLTHKDIGKITRIDLKTLSVKNVFDTGFITNHLHFAKTSRGTLAYVTVGGENAVKVFTMEDGPKLLATIPVGALPHGIWPSDDGSRMYIGLENSDAVDVIDTELNKVIARIPVGQAPQALVYVSGAVPEGGGRVNLLQRPLAPEAVNIPLRAKEGEAKGFIVARNLGLVDALEVSVFKLKPETTYRVYIAGLKTPAAVFKTNPKGMANMTVIGPVREAAPGAVSGGAEQAKVFVMEGAEAPDPAKAVLSGE